MNEYLVYNIDQDLKLVVINDYNTKVSELIKNIHVDTATKIIFSINYLPEENKYRFIEFHIKDNQINPLDYKYLNKNESSVFMTFIRDNQNIITTR
jgi:RAB protein geranylgeranyltransferase component A